MSSMDTSAPAPRVNGELLARFVGRKVLLVGKAESLEGGVMRMRTSDDRVVSVELKGGAAGYSSDFLEFEAVVKSADSVREEEHTSFGSAFGARPAATTALARPRCASRAVPRAALPLTLAETRARQTWATTTRSSSSSTARRSRCSSERHPARVCGQRACKGAKGATAADASLPASLHGDSTTGFRMRNT